MKVLRIASLVALLVVSLSATSAFADDVTINNVLFHQYQQTTNSPCVIGENSCNNPAGFLYTLGTGAGNNTNYDLTSPGYSVGQLRALLNGNGFFVGLDVNQTNNPQTLQGFSITLNGVTTLYSLPSPQSVPAPFNGTGYADYLLAGPNGIAFSLAGLNDSDIITFRAIVDPANDGGEQFFLISANGPTTETPEPASVFLMGTGLVGFSTMLRKRFSK